MFSIMDVSVENECTYVHVERLDGSVMDVVPLPELTLAKIYNSVWRHPGDIS